MARRYAGPVGVGRPRRQPTTIGRPRQSAPHAPKAPPKPHRPHAPKPRARAVGGGTRLMTRQQQDIMILGPEVAAVKYSVTKKRWKQIQQAAKAHGTTVQGYLSGLPKALQPSTQAAINRQAQTQINRAYKPAYADIKNQQTQAQSISDKRQRDLVAWRDWLGTQDQQLTAQADAANLLLRNQQQAISTQAAQQWQQSRDQAVQAASQAKGNVSNPNQANAFDFSNYAGKSAADIANARQESEQLMNIGGTALQAGIAAHGQQLAAFGGQAQQDLAKAMADIASQKSKIDMDKAKDLISFTQNLQNNEVTKASTVQQNQIAEESLNQKAKAQAFDVKKWRQTYGLETKKFAHAKSVDAKRIAVSRRNAAVAEGNLSVAQRNAMRQDKKFKLDKRKFGAAQAKDRYMRTHHLGPYNPKNKTGGMTAGQRANRADKGRNLRSQIYSASDWLLKNKGKAIHIGKNGKPQLTAAATRYMFTQNIPAWQYYAALDLAVHGKLTTPILNNVNRNLKPYGVKWN